jgi:hypothetical protein
MRRAGRRCRAARRGHQVLPDQPGHLSGARLGADRRLPGPESHRRLPRRRRRADRDHRRTYSGAGATLQGKIAFTAKKDNGLVKALQVAVNQLISAGDYAKILARWNLANEAVTTSEINRPGLPIEGK